MKKHFILHRKEDKIDLFFYFMNSISIESKEKRTKIEKRIEKDLKNPNLKLFLVEVTKNKDFTESITNIWLLPIGTSSIWLKYVKSRIMYDLTGVVLVVHEKSEITTWSDHLKYNCG
jgi:hypothetical protein